MEGLFFILVGAALFAQSWSLLGLYSDGRTLGVFVGGAGLLMLGTFMLGSSVEPMLLTAQNDVGASKVATSEATLTAVVAIWAVYLVGVGAQNLWDFDERSTGFFSAAVGVVTLAGFLYFVANLEGWYGVNVWLAMWGSTLILTIIASMLFFYVAFGFNVLRIVSGWFLMIGGGVVGVIGIAIVSGLVKVLA